MVPAVCDLISNITALLPHFFQIIIYELCIGFYWRFLTDCQLI